MSETVEEAEKFLRDRNAYESNVSVLDAIRCAYCQDVVNKLLTIPNLNREIISTAVSSWGDGIVFSFLEQTGMFKYPCESRLSIVSNLIDQVKADRKTITGLQAQLAIARAKMQGLRPATPGHSLPSHA